MGKAGSFFGKESGRSVKVNDKVVPMLNLLSTTQ
jgi:hypothetical protein